MISLALTDNQILKQLPYAYVHRFDMFKVTLVCVVITIIILSILYAIAEEKSSKDTQGTILFVIAPVVVLFSVIAIIGTAMSADNQKLSAEQIATISQAKIDVTETQRVPLASATSAGYSKSEISGSAFYISGSSKDTSSFRYIVKTNGMYQVKTLTDTYGDVNSNDIFINQNNSIEPSLVVEHKKYANPKIAKIINSLPDRSDKWTTYTFNVPENSVATDFNFK